MITKYKLNAKQQAILDLVNKHNEDDPCILNDEQIRIWATLGGIPMMVRQCMDYIPVDEMMPILKMKGN
jgi:hypothetical protein